MAKNSWNINDFSGGVNTLSDKRDLEDNESPKISGYTAHTKGALKHEGAFIQIGAELTGQPRIMNLSIANNKYNQSATYFQTSEHFIKWGKTVTDGADASSGVLSLVMYNPSGGDPVKNEFSAGTPITIFHTTGTGGGEDSYRGLRLVVNSIIGNVLYCELPPGFDTDFSNQTWVFFTGGYMVENAEWYKRLVRHNEPEKNHMILINNGYGKFGYFDIATKSYVGNDSIDFGTNGHTNAFGLDPWFFDTRFLWNRDNIGKDYATGSQSANKDSLGLPTYEANYIDGVVRISEEAPITYDGGKLHRPVGLYYIPTTKRLGFNNSSSSNDYIEYQSGWYPLDQHCLSPTQVYAKTIVQSTNPFSTNANDHLVPNNSDNTNNNSNLQCAGKVFSTFGATTPPLASMNMGAHNVNAINVGIKESDTAPNDGEWDFSSSGAWYQLGIGISYIYDDLNHTDGSSFFQESNVDWLTTDGLYYDGSNGLITINGSENKALAIQWLLDRGTQQTTDLTAAIHDVWEANYAQPSNRGSRINNGNSNHNSWNPRIVGANIWMMANYEEVFESPLWLCTIDFSAEGSSYSHDNTIQNTNPAGGYTGWTSTEQLGSNPDFIRYGHIMNIRSVPILDYETKNGYKHNENIHAWYGTSAIVNRKLYAGNVSYLPDISHRRLDPYEKLIHRKDKILVSPMNSFDILPVDRGLEIAKYDGQEIVKLLNFSNELAVFKSNDLVIIDCSGEDEIIKDTYYGKGIISPNHVVATSKLLFFINASGLYAFDGTDVVDLSSSKLSSADFNKIYSSESNIMFDEKYNILIVSHKYSFKTNLSQSNINNYIIYNITNGSFYHKDLAMLGHSATFLKADITTGLNVNGQLYNMIKPGGIAGSDTADTLICEGSYTPGAHALYSVIIQLGNWRSAEGTALTFGGSTPAGYLTSTMQYLKLYQADGSCVLLNSTPIVMGTAPVAISGDTSGDMTSDQKDAIFKNYNRVIYAIGSAIDSPIYELAGTKSVVHATGSVHNGNNGNHYIQLVFRAKTQNADYTVDPQNLSSINSIYAAAPNTVAPWSAEGNYWTQTEAGKVGIFFSSNTTVGAFGSLGSHAGELGNVKAIWDGPRVSSGGTGNLNVAGVAPTGGTMKFTPDRNGNTIPGRVYEFILEYYSNDPNWNYIDGEAGLIEGSINSFKATYTTGINPYATNNPNNVTWLDDSDANASDNTLNDNIVANMLTALNDGTIVFKNAEDPSSEDYLVDELSANDITVTSAGSSGSKYIQVQLTLASSVISSAFNWKPNTNTSRSDFPAILTKWDNGLHRGLDQNVVQMSRDGLYYETKDIDFGQPNVRKKIYKGYITYIAEDGNIEVYYQANQSGTWTLVTNTTDGRLTASKTQTRAEFTFGTGGNNVYSFALKLEGVHGGQVEINDITLIYRLKNPK